MYKYGGTSYLCSLVHCLRYSPRSLFIFQSNSCCKHAFRSRSQKLCLYSCLAISKQNSIFKIESFRLESNSSNEIYLEVATDALARALKSAAVCPLHCRPLVSYLLTSIREQGSTKATIKLAKKGGEGPGGTGKGAHPVLSIVIESAVRCDSSHTGPRHALMLPHSDAESNGKAIRNHSRCICQGQESTRYRTIEGASLSCS